MLWWTGASSDRQRAERPPLDGTAWCASSRMSRLPGRRGPSHARLDHLLLPFPVAHDRPTVPSQAPSPRDAPSPSPRGPSSARPRVFYDPRSLDPHGSAGVGRHPHRRLPDGRPGGCPQGHPLDLVDTMPRTAKKHPTMRLSTVSRVCSSPCPFLSCASGAGPRFALAAHLGLVPWVLPPVSGVIARPLATAVLGPALALEARDEMEDEGLPLQVDRLVPRDMTEGSWGLAGRQPRRGDHRLRLPRGSAHDPHRPKRRRAAHLGDGVRRPSEPHKRKTIGPAMSPVRAPLAANRNFVAEAHGSANPTPRAMFTLLVRPSRGRCEPPPQETVTEVKRSVVCRVEICRPLWWCLDRAWPSDH